VFLRWLRFLLVTEISWRKMFSFSLKKCQIVMRSLISISGERGIGILDGAYSCNILRRSSPLSRFWIWCFFPPSKDSIFSTFSRVWFTRVSSWVDYFLPHFSSFSLISVFCSSAAILLLSSSLFLQFTQELTLTNVREMSTLLKSANRRKGSLKGLQKTRSAALNKAGRFKVGSI